MNIELVNERIQNAQENGVVLDLSNLEITDQDLIELQRLIHENLDEQIITNITNLDLSGNQIRNIPDHFFEGFNRLTLLRLNNNQIENFPDSILELGELAHLFLEHNQLRSLPTEINNLPLAVLHVDNNQLDNETIEFLQYLHTTRRIFEIEFDGEILNISEEENGSLSFSEDEDEEDREVRLKEIIENLQKNGKLNLSNQRLTDEFLNEFLEVYKDVIKDKKITSLILSNNELTKLPDCINEFDHLQELYVDDNNIETFPSNINLPKLQVLDAHSNILTDISGIFEHSHKLQSLYLSYNSKFKNLQGIENLNELQRLNLTGMQLGKIPTGINQLKNLKHLSLSGNKIESLSSVDLSQLSALQRLNLSNNKLEYIPENIFNIDHKNLEHLDLTGNNIRELPDKINAFKCLTSLNLSGNFFEELPAQIGELAKLEALDLSANEFTYIPDSLTNCKKLDDLDLSSNPITNISNFNFTALSKLKRLDLSSIKLNEIPESLLSLSNLLILDVSDNKLSLKSIIFLQYYLHKAELKLQDNEAYDKIGDFSWRKFFNTLTIENKLKDDLIGKIAENEQIVDFIVKATISDSYKISNQQMINLGLKEICENLVKDNTVDDKMAMISAIEIHATDCSTPVDLCMKYCLLHMKNNNTEIPKNLMLKAALEHHIIKKSKELALTNTETIEQANALINIFFRNHYNLSSNTDNIDFANRQIRQATFLAFACMVCKLEFTNDGVKFIINERGDAELDENKVKKIIQDFKYDMGLEINPAEQRYEQLIKILTKLEISDDDEFKEILEKNSFSEAIKDTLNNFVSCTEIEKKNKISQLSNLRNGQNLP